MMDFPVLLYALAPYVPVLMKNVQIYLMIAPKPQLTEDLTITKNQAFFNATVCK